MKTENKTPVSCVFNGKRRGIRTESEHFYFFHIGTYTKYNYALKIMCKDIKYDYSV
jgi:hypothetical protein